MGIDVGSSTLKIAELELKNDKPYLSNYAWMPILDATGNKSVSSKFFESILPEYLKKIIKVAGFKGKNACIAIPSFEGLITLIDFPQMPKGDMDQAIKFEAQKYIPTSLDNVVINWQIVPEDLDQTPQAGSQKRIKVLLVAASKDKIIAYEKVAGAVGLKLEGIEIENLAMVNSLIGNDKGRFIIVDIGFRVCNIIYVEKGVIKANRNIDAGGDDITDTIAKSMGISLGRAERLKTSDKNFMNIESNIHFSALDMIYQEVARIISAVLGQGKGGELDAIILSGGTAGMTGLKDFFQNKFNVKTIIGNPLSRVDYDKRLESVIGEVKDRFSVSIGLALMGIETQLKKNK